MIKELRAGDPATVGPYRLLGRLGVGGMGQVYLAKSPGGRLVAIKLIRPELAEERGFRARFSSEISAARNVSGIYTAAVVDADSDAELPWMATVYVPGPSLTDAVDDNGPLPVKSVLALAAGLAEALQAIHRAGLVHRDLKPSNVLLAADGPRVIDFGISLALERSMMTATGMVMGSPGFMSPEQARGQREVGAPSDVFSLGAVLAFATTGISPFGIGPTPALLYRVVNEAPDLTSLPARLGPLIEQCLAKDPAERPTPAEVLAALSDDVDVLTGEWLPPAIAESMSRYRPTLQTPLPPALRETGAAESGPVKSSGAEPGTGGPGQAAGAAESVSATRVEHGLLPDTSLVPMSNPFTSGQDAAGDSVPGETSELPPAGPPSPLRRWRWPITAAAAAIVVAVVALLLTSHSPGASPRVGPTGTASFADDATPPPPSPATAGQSAATSQPTGFAPAAQAPTARASGTPVSSPTATWTPTSSPTTAPTPTPTPTSSASPTTAPTSTPTPTQTAPATAPPSPSTAPSSQAPTAADSPAASPALAS